MNRKAWNVVAIVAAVSFSLHLVWENAQAPLFTCFWQDWVGCLAACLRATVGDMVITLVVWGAVAALAHDWQWVNTLRAPGIVSLVLAGALIAVGIEQHALAFDRWAYTTAMPLVPSLNVGLLPVLQLALLLPVTFLVSRKLSTLIV